MKLLNWERFVPNLIDWQ